MAGFEAAESRIDEVVEEFSPFRSLTSDRF